MLQLSEPARIGSVTVNLNSTGTAVQIRSSSTATPSSLEDTTALTEPTTLKPGSNTIEVDDAEISVAGRADRHRAKWISFVSQHVAQAARRTSRAFRTFQIMTRLHRNSRAAAASDRCRTSRAR